MVRGPSGQEQRVSRRHIFYPGGSTLQLPVQCHRLVPLPGEPGQILAGQPVQLRGESLLELGVGLFQRLQRNSQGTIFLLSAVQLGSQLLPTGSQGRRIAHRLPLSQGLIQVLVSLGQPALRLRQGPLCFLRGPGGGLRLPDGFRQPASLGL